MRRVGVVLISLVAGLAGGLGGAYAYDEWIDKGSGVHCYQPDIFDSTKTECVPAGD